jgi:hypothetical protein
MNVLVVVALLGAVGLGFENDWKIAKSYKSYNDCRVENPKFHNTMTQWKYDPCSITAYKLQNK